MSINKLIGLAVVAFVMSLPLRAATVALNPEHPTRYVVRQGDTLWDISGRFLREPWRWPAIWEANPQVKNPHLIFPGDELMLTYKDGKPVLQLRRGARPTVKLSPGIRAYPLDGAAIPSIPIDAIQQFLSRPRVVGETELGEAPYVVSVGKEHIVGGAPSRVYVRGTTRDQGRRYIVYRQGPAYVEPDSGEVLGYEALHVGDLVIEEHGDPAKAFLTKTNREVLPGDRLLPVIEDAVSGNFFPRAPEQEVSGKILSVVDGVTQIGQHQVVVVSLGEQDGIKVGDVMAVYQAGDLIKDPFAPQEDISEPPSRIEYDPSKQGGLDGFTVAVDRTLRRLGVVSSREVRRFTDPDSDTFETVRLPEERAGVLMVFRPYERVSYALVMKATRPMHIHDSVRNP